MRQILDRNCRLILCVALVLPLCGCDVVSSWTGQAAKSLLDRAADGLDGAGGERVAGDDSPVAGSASARGNPAEHGASKDANVYYQYVDESGSVRFVTSKAEIPAKYRGAAGRIEVDKRQRRIAAPTPTAPRRSIWKDAAEAPWSGSTPDVVMYTAPWCGVCKRAEAYFNREGVRYTSKDIEASDAYKRELVQKTGRSAVPVIEIGDERMIGFDQRRLASLLKD